MSFYTDAIAGLPAMLLDTENPLGNFKRNLYAGQFQAYCGRHEATLQALEDGYRTVIDKEQYLTNMAAALTAAAVERLDGLKKNGQKDQAMMDMNLVLAVYLIPSVREFAGESAAPFEEKLLAAWKETFPKSNVQGSDFAGINAGFRRKYCYITTAVCQTFGKPDDCYELNLFRDFRDHYLETSTDGESAIRRYYDVAPTIVKHINKKRNRDEIYRGIWDTYLEPCMRMIERGKNEECRDLYLGMVKDLEDRYFH